MNQKIETDNHIIEHVIGDIILVYNKNLPTKVALLTSIDRLIKVGQEANAKENS